MDSIVEDRQRIDTHRTDTEYVVKNESRLSEFVDLFQNTDSLKQFRWTPKEGESDAITSETEITTKFDIVPSMSPAEQEVRKAQIDRLAQKVPKNFQEDIQSFAFVTYPYVEDNFDRFAKEQGNGREGHFIRRAWENNLIAKAVESGIATDETDARSVINNNKFSGNRLQTVVQLLSLLPTPIIGTFKEDEIEKIKDCKADISGMNKGTDTRGIRILDAGSTEEKKILIEGISARLTRLLDDLVPLTSEEKETIASAKKADKKAQ